MEKDKLFGGFDAISEALSGASTSVNPKNEDDDFDIVDPSKLNEDDEEESSVDDTPIDDTTTTTGIDKIVDNSRDINDGLKDESSKDSFDDSKSKDEDDESTTTDKIEDLSEAEPEIAAYVQEKLFEKFGWDLEDEDKLKNLDELTEYLQQVVEENSIPKYANTEIEKLNSFVANGGRLEDYFKVINSNVDIDNVDLTKEYNQEAVLKEYFRSQNISEDKLNKRIERYRDTGTLEDEAIDALELLKGYKKQETEKLLVEQENYSKEVQKQQQKFYDDVRSDIETRKEISGISISPSEKKQLMDFIFKANNKGQTKLQEYITSSHKNLIDTAYFAMMKDKLVTRMEKKATSNTALNLKKKLESRTKRGSNSDAGLGNGGRANEDYSAFSEISSLLSKPTSFQ